MILKCTKCKEDRPSSEFYRKSSRPSGFQDRCKDCSRKGNLEWRAKNPERRRELDRRSYVNAGQARARERKYNVTPEEQRILLAEQGNLCAICGDSNPTHLDHDHLSGRVRGFLCAPCNKGLGHFKDNADNLKKASEYLNGFRGMAEDSPAV